MAEMKFSLNWEGYHATVTSVFNHLRLDEELVDITLCCEGQQVRAHRMMLSACSPYFRDILTNNPCQQMVLFLRDTPVADLRAVVEFMYTGSVDVPESQLPSFIRTAEMLQIRGLSDHRSQSPQSSEGSVLPGRPSTAELRPPSFSARPASRRRAAAQTTAPAAPTPTRPAPLPPPPPLVPGPASLSDSDQGGFETPAVDPLQQGDPLQQQVDPLQLMPADSLRLAGELPEQPEPLLGLADIKIEEEEVELGEALEEPLDEGPDEGMDEGGFGGEMGYQTDEDGDGGQDMDGGEMEEDGSAASAAAAVERRSGSLLRSAQKESTADVAGASGREKDRQGRYLRRNAALAADAKLGALKPVVAIRKASELEAGSVNRRTSRGANGKPGPTARTAPSPAKAEAGPSHKTPNVVQTANSEAGPSHKTPDVVQTGPRKHRCRLCGYMSQHKGILALHIRKWHAEIKESSNRKYKCDYCNYSADKATNLALHVRLHSGERPFRCDLCGKTFAQKGNLDKHVLLHSGYRFRCIVCGAKFKEHAEFKEHRISHYGERPFRCNVCDKVFPFSSRLKRHKQLAHRKQLARQTAQLAVKQLARRTRNARKTYRCALCYKTFSLRDRLETHKKIAHFDPEEAAMNKCDMCDKAFVRSGFLDRHKRLTHGTPVGENMTDTDSSESQSDAGEDLSGALGNPSDNGENPSDAGRASLVTDDKQADGHGQTQWSPMIVKRSGRQSWLSMTDDNRLFVDETQSNPGRNPSDLDERPWKCDHCDRIFTHSGFLKRHERLTHGVNAAKRSND